MKRTSMVLCMAGLAFTLCAGGIQERMETKFIPVAADRIMSFDFSGADLDIYSSGSGQLELMNNEFTNPRYSLAINGGNVCFDIQDYATRFGTSNRAERPKFILRIPGNIQIASIRGERIRIREYRIDSEELAIQCQSLEIRDAGTLPTRLRVVAKSLICRDSTFSSTALDLSGSSVVELKNVHGTNLSLEGSGRIALSAHHVTAAQVALGSGLDGEGPSVWSACQIASWSNTSGITIKNIGGM